MLTITKKDLIDRMAHDHQVKQSLVKVTIQSFLDEIWPKATVSSSATSVFLKLEKRRQE